MSGADRGRVTKKTATGKKANEKPLRQCREEYALWRADHAAWLVDVRQWRRQEQQALALLFSMEQAMPGHRPMLDRHEQRIREHESMLNACESMIAELQAGHVHDDRYAGFVDEHARAGARHDEVNRMHDEMERKHSAAMSGLKKLAARMLEL